MKKEEAAQRTISVLLKIAQTHFTRYGYFDVSLETIAKEGDVTRGAVYHHFKNKKNLFLAVLDNVQEDIAVQIEQEALKSNDPWEQLILGCAGFIKGANTQDNRRILLVDAPAVVGWDAWRKADQENSMNVLQQHIDDLKEMGCLAEGVDTRLMTLSISGALNELALSCPAGGDEALSQGIYRIISQMVDGFKRR